MSDSGQTIGRGDWGWYASADEETYTVGPCATREDAIAEGTFQELGLDAREPGEPQVFHIIEAIQAPIDLGFAFSADSMIERMCEHIEDNYGDSDRGFLTEDAWTPEQQKDLEARLAATVRAWQSEHNIVLVPHLFTDSRNAERIEIPAKSSSPSPVPSSALPQVVSPSA